MQRQPFSMDMQQRLQGSLLGAASTCRGGTKQPQLL
jgi:hypothetical protein